MVSCSNVTATYAKIDQIDGLVQDRRYSCELAMELRFSCTNPSKCNAKVSMNKMIVIDRMNVPSREVFILPAMILFVLGI